jgi:hypothetical protein
MSMVVEVGQGEGEYGDSLEEPCRRGKCIKTLMPQESLHLTNSDDTGPWTSKGKSVKKAIGRSWSKWFHASGIPDRNVNNPYFISAVKQTVVSESLCISMTLFYNIFSCNCVVFQVRGSLLHREETLMTST